MRLHKTILAELGQIDFWKIAMKPGKPFAFGRLGKVGSLGCRAILFQQRSLIISWLCLLYDLCLEKNGLNRCSSAIAQQSFKKHPGQMVFSVEF